MAPSTRLTIRGSPSSFAITAASYPPTTGVWATFGLLFLVAGLVCFIDPARSFAGIACVPTQHVPSDVIIDASMPAAIRTSGQTWNPEGKQQDTKFESPWRYSRKPAP